MEGHAHSFKFAHMKVIDDLEGDEDVVDQDWGPADGKQNDDDYQHKDDLKINELQIGCPFKHFN